MIKVFGHLNPDTDTVGSAVIWAWYLNTHTSQEAEAFALGELNKETKFMLRRWNTPEPAILESIAAGDDIIVVDTNNPQELLSGINEANLLQIIDHHKLYGGIETKGPVDITMRLMASTASVIYGLMSEHAETLPDNIAGIILSCILSDTLAFRSPTTTPHDKDIAEKLAKRLNIDITEYSNEMFAAKSDVSDFSDTGIINLDAKKSAVGDKNVLVSVVETTAPETVLVRKDGLIAAMQDMVAKDNDLAGVLLFIVDIFKEEATVITYDEFTQGVIAASFDVTVDTDIEVLPGIVSRKKQILPVLKLPAA